MLHHTPTLPPAIHTHPPRHTSPGLPACLPAEYCARGSLYDLLKAARCTPALQKALDWPRRIMMAMDAAKVQYSLRCAVCDCTAY